MQFSPFGMLSHFFKRRPVQKDLLTFLALGEGSDMFLQN